MFLIVFLSERNKFHDGHSESYQIDKKPQTSNHFKNDEI